MARTLTLPLALGPGGSFQTITHGHPAEIAQSVALLLATQPGERRSNPDYGFTTPAFGGINTELVDAAVAEWEPRATPGAVDVALTGTEETATVNLQPADSSTDVVGV